MRKKYFSFALINNLDMKICNVFGNLLLHMYELQCKLFSNEKERILSNFFKYVQQKARSIEPVDGDWILQCTFFCCPSFFLYLKFFDFVQFDARIIFDLLAVEKTLVSCTATARM